MASEWDVLKAHARAQCVTAKDRLWCEMALALGEAVRRIAIRGEATPPMVRQAWYGVQPRKVQDVADALARAERKAAKAAKQAAREERKRMRRAAANESVEVSGGRLDLRIAQDLLRRARKNEGREWLWASDYRYFHEYVAARRRRVREVEISYAIACAEAGAVPGGRVH